MLKRLVNAPLTNPAIAKKLPEHEARLGQAAFEGLVPVAEVGAAGVAPWLVEENVEGETLRTLLASLAMKKGRLSPNEGFAVLLEVATILADLHAPSVPVVHGDLCPSTIIVTPGGGVRLAEAGVARLCAEAVQGPVRSEAQSVTPEQLQGTVEAPGDLFRLGLVMHELALGRPLFPTGDLGQANGLGAAFAGVGPQSFPSVPEPFASMLVRFLSLDPAQRPSAQDAKFALQQGIQRMGWTVGAPVVASLFAKAFPSREPLANLWHIPGDELTLSPLDQAQAPAGGAPEDDKFPFMFPSTPGATPFPMRGEAPSPAAPPSGAGLNIQVGINEASLPPAPLPRPATLVPTAPLEAEAPPSPPPPAVVAPTIPPVGPAYGGSPSPVPRIAPVTRAATMSLVPEPPEEVLEEMLEELDEAEPEPVRPRTPAEGAPAATLARIGVRKVSLDELKALKAADAPPPKPARKADSAPRVRDQRIGEHLLAQGRLTQERYDEALSYAVDFEASMPDALVAITALEEDDVITAWAEVTRAPTITGKRLDEMPPVPEALRLLSSGAAEALCAVPLSLKGSTQLVVALRDPLDEGVLAEVKAQSKMSSVVAIRAGEQAIRRTLARFYGTPVAASLPSWLENASGGSSSGGRASSRILQRHTTLPPALAGTPLDEAGAGADPVHRLLELLLLQLGEKGPEAHALLKLVAEVTVRVGLKPEEGRLVWLAAAAVASLNASANRKAADLSRLDEVATRMGPAWEPLASIAAPAAGPRAPVSWLPAAVFAACFGVGNVTSLAHPSLTEAMPGIEQIRSRIPGVVVDAIVDCLKRR